MAAELKTTTKYRRRWGTLAVLSLSLVIIGMDNTILNVAIPTLQRELNASASTLQWMVDAYILVFAGLLLTMGSLGDRLGRAKMLRVGLIIFGVSSVGAAYSDSSNQLIAARAVMGAGAALIMPATLSIITDVFPREERGRAIGIWAGVAGLGIGTGPLVGGLLLEHFWWGSVFLINIPVVGVALLAGTALVPDSRDPEPSALDLPGALTSIAAVSTFVFAIIEAPSRGWGDSLVVVAFVLAAVFAVAFVYRELTAAHPMIDFTVFRNPRFTFGAAAISVAFFALFGFIFGLTQYFQFVQGFSPLEAGMRTAPVAIGMMIGSTNSYRLVRRFGTAKVIAGALTLLAGVLMSVMWWEVDTSYGIIMATIIVMSLAMSNTMAPSTDAVMGAVSPAKAGVASAMNDVTRQVGGALGIAVMGSVMNATYADRMSGAVDGLTKPFAEAAQDSIGGAVRAAETLPMQESGVLLAAAAQSFTDAYGLALFAGVAAALAGAVLVFRFMPPTHLPQQMEPGADPADTHDTARPVSSSTDG